MKQSFSQVLLNSQSPRADYEPEIAFYSTIKAGDVEKTKTLCKEKLSQKHGLGCLSKNPLQSLRYHLAITIAMIARSCIEGGMDLETSYGLSDFYIQQLDSCEATGELDEIHYAVATDYAARMKKLQTNKINSTPIAKCIDYINQNIHAHISVEDIARQINVTSSYLSRLFRKETSITIMDYVRNRKIAAAKDLLLHTDFSIADVSYILAFNDQSHFTDVFRKAVGTTPKKFRESARKTAI